jgi:hypothetical protein
MFGYTAARPYGEADGYQAAAGSGAMNVDPKRTLSVIRAASPYEYLFVALMILPPLLIAWLAVTEKLRFSDEWAKLTVAIVLVAYLLAGLLLLAGSILQRDRKVACLQILSYLDSRQFKVMSFDRVRQNISSRYTDQFLDSVVRAYPELLRPARLKGKKVGVAKVQRVEPPEAEEEHSE